MERVILQATKRTGTGTRDARRIRAKGRVPAVLYGHKMANVNLVVNEEQVVSVLRQGLRVVTLRTDGTTDDIALIKEVQHDAFNSKIVHVDFARVSLDERVHVAVPLETWGHAVGEKEGGMVELLVKELHLDCQAVSIPEECRVDVSGLEIGQTVHAGMVPLPAGTNLLDPEDLPVVAVHLPRKAVAEEAAEEEEGVEEPEVIGDKDEQAEEASEEG